MTEYEKKNDYNSYEDIENHLLLYSKSSDNQSDNGSSEVVVKEENKDYRKIQPRLSTSLVRVLNTLSILFLLCTFFGTLVNKINNHDHNNYMIMEHLTKAIVQAEINFMVLYVALFFVCSKNFIEISKSRNGFNKECIYDKKR